MRKIGINLLIENVNFFQFRSENIIETLIMTSFNENFF